MLLLAACAPSEDTPDAADDGEVASDARDADPGCCPIGSLGSCGPTPRGGWAGFGCADVYDLGANAIVMDTHGCPTLVNTGVCNCLCPDSGVDAGREDDAGTEEDAGTED